MSVEPRPSDNITVDFLQLGMPFVEFAPLLTSGTFGPFRSLGIIDTAEVAKAIELVALRSAQSGISILVRELVRQFDATLNVGIFQHSAPNMQLLFASASNTVISGGVTAVVDDAFNLGDDEQDFLDLQNQLIVEPLTGSSAAEITDEDVGTGDGTSGDTSGDFRLNFKPFIVGDVTSVTVAGVAFTAIATGAAAAGNEVEVEVGATVASGDLQFFVGGVAANVTGAILATYEPSFAFVENTDFVVDYQQGRIRYLNVEDPAVPSTDELKFFQPMEASYDFNEVDHNNLVPYTQFVFQGQTRIRLLTDVGINIIWTIPNTSVRLTDDAFVFNRDEFQVSQLTFQLLDNGGNFPFGIMELYEETP